MMGSAKTCWALGVCMLVVAACGSDNHDGPPVGSSAPAPVVVRTDAASSADCPNGGVIVLAGVDSNGNAALDDAEVQMRTVVCNPPPASPDPKTVVRLVEEPVGGAHCAEGGTAVQTGPDTNGNGQLDDEEVTHVDYICGDRLLTRIESEPPGANCVAGGVALLAGPDRDHDGVLDDEEVEHTDYACGDVLTQNVTIHSNAEVAALANIVEITGTLIIDEHALLEDGEISFPALRHIDNNLMVLDNRYVSVLHLPKLEAVGAYVTIARNARLQTLDTPVLNQTGRSIFIGDNPMLTDLAQLRLLSQIGGNYAVVRNAALASLPTPAGWIGGVLDIEDNPSLASLDVDALDHLDEAFIYHNGITELTLSVSKIVSSTAVIDRLVVMNNPVLTRLQVLVDQAGSVQLTGNAALVHALVTLDAVTGDLFVQGNPELADLTLMKLSMLFPNTLSVGGELFVDAPLRTFGDLFSSLDIAGPCTLNNTRLTSLRIQRIGGKFTLDGNTELTGDIIIEQFHGGVEVVGNPVLDHLFFWVQPDVLDGNVVISGNPLLRSAQLLLMARTIHGNLTIMDNDSMFATMSDGIEHVTGAITIEHNSKLSEIDLERLQSASNLYVLNNPSLPSLALPALQSVQSIVVSRNPLLPTCQVDALFAQVPGSSNQQSNNDDAATCP